MKRLSAQPERRLPLPLPLRIIPEADESLFGFILRLAHRNDLSDASLIIEAMGVADMCGPISNSALEMLSALSSRTIEELKAMQPPQARRGNIRLHGRILPDEICDRDFHKVCPLCLVERPIYRTVWELSPYLVCPKHRTRLLDKCPTCGRWLRRQSRCPRFLRCPAGHFLALRDFRAHAEPSLSSAYLEWCLTAGTPLPAVLCDFPPDMLSLKPRDFLLLANVLARLMPRLADRTLPTHAFFRIQGRELDIGMEAMASWPECLMAYLEQPHGEVTTHPFSVRTMELLQTCGERLRRQGVPDVLSKAARDFARSRGFLLGGTLADRSKGGNRLVKASVAMKIMGLPLRRFLALIEAEGWEGRQGVHVNRRHFLLKEDLERWLRLNRDNLNIQQAADVLGCRTTTVRILTSEGAFGVGAKARNRSKSERLLVLYRQEIAGLVSAVKQAIIPEGRPTRTIALAKALRPSERWSSNLARSILAIMAGKIVPSAWDGQALGDIRLSEKETDRLAKMLGFQPRPRRRHVVPSHQIMQNKRKK